MHSRNFHVYLDVITYLLFMYFYFFFYRIITILIQDISVQNAEPSLIFCSGSTVEINPKLCSKIQQFGIQNNATSVDFRKPISKL